MRSPLPLLLVACVVTAIPLHGQDAAAPTAAGDFQSSDARSVAPSGPGRLKQSSGTLVLDARLQQVVFTRSASPIFVVPFDRITLLHYEESKYPSRRFWRGNYFIGIYYTDDRGEPVTATLRFLSRERAQTALAAFRRTTGLDLDRTLATRSFASIPIRAGVGAKVVVTDVNGIAHKGRIAKLSPEAVDVTDRHGEQRRFDRTNLSRMRWQYDGSHSAKVGFAWGAAFGIYAVWLSSALGGCGEPEANCHVAGAMALSAAMFGGAGAGLGAALGAIRYPFNGVYDVYRGTAIVAPRRSGVTLTPEITASRSGVVMSVGF